MSGLPVFYISPCSLDSYPLTFSRLTSLIETDVIKIIFNKKLCMKPRINQTAVLEVYGCLYIV